MVGISAAARGSRTARVVAAAALLGVVLALATGSARPAPTAAVPLVQVTPTELRLSQPLSGLAAAEGRAAFAFCNQLVGLWRPGSTSVTQLGPPAQWKCPPPRGLERIYSIALAGDRVAWAAAAGGIQVTSLVFQVVLGQPQVLTIAASVSYCCRGSDPDPQRLGDVHGDGGLTVFSSRVKCGELGAPPCPAGAPRTVVSQTVWRLRSPPFQASCVGQPGPCQQLTTSTGVLEPLSVGGGRIATRPANGSLEIRNAAGSVVRTFPALAGRVRGAEIMGGRVVVLVPGKVLELAIANGAVLHSRAVPQVSSGGVCGTLPCPAVRLRLLDAARGLVAYVLDGKLVLLRMKDGTRRVVGPATDARFGSKGLFLARTGAAPWVARIRFVPWRSLPVRP
jgi:hypothetical protein